ncbi:MAG: hypothetical protein LPK00_03390 [Bacillaceae bacterium]|nr:hypothetical protein [Bacillaceae bacterium]
MKKIYSFSIMFLVIVVLILLMGWNERNPAFATPQEALENEKHLRYDIKELIDTKIYGDQAYIISYTTIGHKEHYLISKYIKNKKGWIFVDSALGLEISRKYANGKIRVGGSDNGYQHGIATWKVDRVTQANHTADLIPLKEENLKIWIFYNQSLEDMKAEMLFKDVNGDKILD